MSDDTPTQGIHTSANTDVNVAIEEEGKKSRGLMIALIAIGALLLIGLIIVLIILLGRNDTPIAVGTTTPTPSASPTPSQTPSATPTPTVAPTPTATSAPPPPPSTKPSITGYSISPSQIDCSSGTPNLSIHWSSVNGKNAYFGVNTNDAMAAGMGWVLPPTGSDANFPDGYHPFQALCGNDSTEYTITILGKDGSKVSKHFTVTKK